MNHPHRIPHVNTYPPPPPPPLFKWLTLPTSGSLFKGTVLPIFPSSRVTAFISINSNSCWGSTRNHDLMGFKVCKQLPPTPQHTPTLPWATSRSIFEGPMQHVFQQEPMINEHAWFNGVEWLWTTPPSTTPLCPPHPPSLPPKGFWEEVTMAAWNWVKAPATGSLVTHAAWVPVQVALGVEVVHRHCHGSQQNQRARTAHGDVENVGRCCPASRRRCGGGGWWWWRWEDLVNFCCEK